MTDNNNYENPKPSEEYNNKDLKNSDNNKNSFADNKQDSLKSSFGKQEENLKISSWENWLEKIGFKGEKKKQAKLLLLVLMIGLILIILSSFNTKDENNNETNVENISSGDFSTFDEEARLEEKLEGVLVNIEGVGNVSVSVTLASGSRTEYAVNASTTVNETEENNSDGSIKNTTQTTSSNDIVFEGNNESPVVVQKTRAEVQGVLIVAEGGDNSNVCSQIVTAVSALLDIPVHKITVCAAEIE